MDAAYVEKQEKNFWKLIDKSKEESETTKEQLEELTALLSVKSEEELVAFEINLRKNLKILNLPQMVALCAILGSSFKVEKDRVRFPKHPTLNGFLYFKCWMVLQGKEIMENAIKDIQTLRDADVNIETVKAEGLLHATQSAFNPDDEDDIIIKAANKFDKKLNYDLEEVLPDEGVDYDNLDVTYADLVKTVVELGE